MTQPKKPKEPKNDREVTEGPEHGPQNRDPDGAGAPSAADPTEHRSTTEEAPRE